MRARFHVPILIALVGATLAACGGDGAPARPAPGTPENPLVGQKTEESASGATRESTTASRRTGEPTAGEQASEPDVPPSEPSAGAGGQEPQAPGYQALVEGQTSHPASRFTPCNLVTANEARAIVGAPMQAPIEAPQGPTCIYRTQTSKSMITLAVQATDFSKIKPRLRGRREVAVSDRAGFCGTYGQSMLYVPLATGRVLSISAPCDLARDFAAKALRRL